MNKNEYDLKLVNFAPLIPILDQFFISPLHVEQVFFSYRPKGKGLEVFFCGKNPTGGALQKRKPLMSS
jgi:hypothetical protein